MPGSPAACTASAPHIKMTDPIRNRIGVLCPKYFGAVNCSLAYRHFFPLSVLFFPIVERLSIHFVNSGVCDFHVARLSSQKEIDVISLAVGRFHIDAGEVLSAAQVGEPVVVHPYQVEGEIVALMVHVKLSVA